MSLENEEVYKEKFINYGITTFDNMGKSLLTVFQIITMDSWTTLMYNTMDSELYFLAAIYYCTLIFLGSFFLINLILAIILDSFTKV